MGQPFCPGIVFIDDTPCALAHILFLGFIFVCVVLLLRLKSRISRIGALLVMRVGPVAMVVVMCHPG